MTRYIILALVFSVLGGLGGASAGYEIGNYVTRERLQKQALAHECGYIDALSLAFRWHQPMTVQMAAAALPTSALGKK